MEYSFVGFNSANDLYDNFLEVAKDACGSAEKEPLEIERKWLVKPEIREAIRDLYPGVSIKRSVLDATYLLTDPEFRLRIRKDSNCRITKFTNFECSSVDFSLTAKLKSTDRGLVRTEYQLAIGRMIYERIYERILNSHNYLGNNPFIRKVFTGYKLDNHTWEISTVENLFTYMEIEFSSIEEARAFVIPKDLQPFVIGDVTDIPFWKMKNIWSVLRDPTFDVTDFVGSVPAAMSDVVINARKTTKSNEKNDEQADESVPSQDSALSDILEPPLKQRLYSAKHALDTEELMEENSSGKNSPLMASELAQLLISYIAEYGDLPIGVVIPGEKKIFTEIESVEPFNFKAPVLGSEVEIHTLGIFAKDSDIHTNVELM